MSHTIQVGKTYKVVNHSRMWNHFTEGTVVKVLTVNEGMCPLGYYHRVEAVTGNEGSQVLLTSQLEEVSTFKVGDKAVIVSGFDVYHYIKHGTEVEVRSADRNERFMVIDRAKDHTQYVLLTHLAAVETDPVEIAKANLAKAEAELKAAEEAKAEAERKSKEFTGDDLKTLMIVRNKDSGQLRMVTTNSDITTAITHSTEGNQVNSCSYTTTTTELLKWMNSWYEKTNLTLKDFANA
jgi:predicted regulator of Ras-like GTPase activity (Roadblock/LC7/MglB family)